MTNKPKAVATHKITARTCFVDGTKRVQEKCAGKPGSAQCAACRLRKNYMGVSD